MNRKLDLTLLSEQPGERARQRLAGQETLFKCVDSRLKLLASVREYMSRGLPPSGELVAFLGSGKYSSAVRMCYPEGNCKVDVAVKIGVSQRELRVTEYLSKFVEHGFTQGLPLYYGYREYEVKRKSENTGQVVNEIAVCMMSELANGVLDEDRFVSRIDPDLGVQSLVFQGLHTLRTVNLRCLFLQGDMHVKNMFVHDIEPGGHWTYVMTHAGRMRRSYRVPNVGVLLTIADFGQTHIQPKINGVDPLVSDEVERLIMALHQRTKRTISQDSADWLLGLVQGWKKYVEYAKREKWHSWDALGDFIELSFVNMFTEGQGSELCSFDDNARDLSEVPPLPNMKASTF